MIKVKPTTVRLKDGTHAMVTIQHGRERRSKFSNTAHLYTQDALKEARYAAREIAGRTGATLDDERIKARPSWTTHTQEKQEKQVSNGAMIAFGGLMIVACVLVGFLLMLFIG